MKKMEKRARCIIEGILKNYGKLIRVVRSSKTPQCEESPCNTTARFSQDSGSGFYGTVELYFMSTGGLFTTASNKQTRPGVGGITQRES